MDLAQNYDHLNADDEVHRAICKIIRMVGVSCGSSRRLPDIRAPWSSTLVVTKTAHSRPLGSEMTIADVSSQRNATALAR